MSQELEQAIDRAIQLCEWIGETPHQRGSINGLAAQVQHELHAALARTHQPEQAAQPGQAAKASLREAAQNALVTLDGIANANPRDKADFETSAEWIAWAKSRARWAADALRAPVSQEIYAERILRQMLAMPEEERSPAQQAAQVVPEVREALKELYEVMQESMGTGGWVPTPLHQSFVLAMGDAAKALAASQHGEGAAIDSARGARGAGEV